MLICVVAISKVMLRPVFCAIHLREEYSKWERRAPLCPWHVEKLVKNEVKVLVHPQLGRLEVSQDAIKPVEKPPAWTSTISGGINAGNKDGDGTFTANISGTSNYKSDTDRLKIQAGLNYSKNNDKGKPTEVKTDKGMANICYDRFLNKTVTLYAKSDYQYNGLMIPASTWSKAQSVSAFL